MAPNGAWLKYKANKAQRISNRELHADNPLDALIVGYDEARS